MILAFETSAKAASVALLESGKLLGESYQNTGLTHSQTLLSMAEDLLRNCGKTAEDVTAVAVANSPISVVEAVCTLSASISIEFIPDSTQVTSF